MTRSSKDAPRPVPLLLLGELHQELFAHVEKHLANRPQDPHFRETWNRRLAILEAAWKQTAAMRYLPYWIRLESEIDSLLRRDDSIAILMVEMRINLNGDHRAFIEVGPQNGEL